MKSSLPKGFAFFLFFLIFQNTNSQSVGINSDGSPPHNSAMLDVSANNRGILIPSVALTGTTDVSTISSPALSLLVYNTATNTDITPGYYYWDGTKWTHLSTQWSKSNSSIYYNEGFVGVGTEVPLFDLDVTNAAPGGSVAVAVNTEDSGGALAAYSSTFPFPFTHFADRVSLWSNAFTSKGLDLRADGGASDIRFYTGGGSEANERMRILSNGAIGIGTMSPLSKLSVDNNGLGGISIKSYRDDGMGSWQEGLFFANNSNGLGPWMHAGIWADGVSGFNGELVFGVDGDNLNNLNGIQEVMRINKSGNLGIGVSNPLAKLHVADNVIIGASMPAVGYALSVDGKVMAEEMRIEDSGGWPDYVFEWNYPLLTLDALKKTIKEEGHLPGIPSAEQIDENGIMLGVMLKRQMEKIEEMTLYIIQLHERITELENNKK